jgi:pyruvate/2-oxoglutarate dehydrogenase complex dihydrolipoamide acyltransferase (E2) component
VCLLTVGAAQTPAGSGRFQVVMTIDIRIPKLGMEMTEATLAEWLVDDGARVEQDQPIYLLETDKVETEIPAPVAGVLRRIGDEGGTYPVGEIIGELSGDLPPAAGR